jgi:UDP-N-acetylglucosamine/UDP-N-acetylgalactosamine 4-epimerase
MRTWLITGVAGFIGSNLLEALLKRDQRVAGLDNYSTGQEENLRQVEQSVRADQWSKFSMIEGNICDLKTCQLATRGVDYVLHQAALGSVPRSIEAPLNSHASNVTGFLNMLIAARDCGVKRFVYASSSSVYGDHTSLPKVEEHIGCPLSPYAATKVTNEIYARAFTRCYGMEAIGLRYFNVFGPRQVPNGPYAAVIPKWIQAMIANEPLYINGDGETSRDFCYVANVVQANLRAAGTENREAVNEVYNVAIGERTTLKQLFCELRNRLLPQFPHLAQFKPHYREFRAGDVRHSHADISKARKLLDYEPTHRIENGLDEALQWYVANLSHRAICEGALQV